MNKKYSNGARLKQIRKLLNVTQQKFADAIEIERGAYGMIELGRVGLTDRNARRLCEMYPQINIDYILTGQGEPLKDVAPEVSETPTPDRQKTENQYLKRLREILNLSQEKMASVVRLEQSAYSRIESGINTLREVHKDLIEIELSVPKEYFTTGDVQMIPLKAVQDHLRNKKEAVSSQSPIPVLYARPPVGQTYHEFMKEATEHESIPTLNGFANFKTIIRDEALTGLFKYGRFIYVHAQDAKGILAWGAVYLVNIGDLQFVRYIQKSPNKDCIILRADEQCRDRYEDIEVKRSEVSFMGIAVADMGFVQVGTLQAA